MLCNSPVSLRLGVILLLKVVPLHCYSRLPRLPVPSAVLFGVFFFIKYNIGREFDACGTWELGLGLVKNTLLLTEVTIHVGLY